MSGTRLPIVLLVDDNLADIELMRIAFEECRVEADFRIALDGVAALEELQRGLADPALLPDLVLLDLNMPKLNGREVLAFIRRQPALKDLPTVVLTTSVLRRDYDDCMAMGASGFEVKPTMFEGLRELVKRLQDLLPTAR